MKKQSKKMAHGAKSEIDRLQSPKKPKKHEIIQLVWKLAEPICSSEGMELIFVEYQREPGGRILRLYIDRPGGIALDDCAMVSRQIGDILDVHLDSNVPPYHLEVSSPGSQRPATYPTATRTSRPFSRTRR